MEIASAVRASKVISVAGGYTMPVFSLDSSKVEVGNVGIVNGWEPRTFTLHATNKSDAALSLSLEFLSPYIKLSPNETHTNEHTAARVPGHLFGMLANHESAKNTLAKNYESVKKYESVKSPPLPIRTGGPHTIVLKPREHRAIKLQVTTARVIQ